jgi:excisionase family DNA binding protein
MTAAPSDTPTVDGAAPDRRPPMSTQQAADYLGVSKSTIRRWVREGRLTNHKLGHRTVRYHPEDLDRFVGRS